MDISRVNTAKKKTRKDDELYLQFDQYQRYRLVADLVKQLKKNGEYFSILEVGSNFQLSLGKFLPDADIVYQDFLFSECPPENIGQNKIVAGDAIYSPFAERAFDIVVCIDVFEHIKKSLRLDFIKEMIRLSKRCVILGAPFDTTDVALHEDLLNEEYKIMSGNAHPWLEEHIIYQLPSLEWTVAEIKKIGLNVQVFENGYLPRWAKMMRASFWGGLNNNLKAFLDRIQLFYNHIFYPYDNKGPSYRKILFISDLPIQLDESSKEEDDCSKRNEKILDELIEELLFLSNRIELTHQIQEYYLYVKKLIKLIQEKDSIILQKNLKIAEADAHINKIEKELLLINQSKRLYLKSIIKKFMHIKR